MRWLFHDANNPDESLAFQETLKRVDAWWRAFEGTTNDLDALFARRAEGDLPSWRAANLQSIDKSLMWEYGPLAERCSAACGHV
jgi:hypothetical protein